MSGRPDGGACVGLFWMADVEDGAERLAEARAVCRACPVLTACRTWALTSDVGGVVAGLTDTERGAYRQRHRIKLEQTTIADYLPARELTPDVLDDLPVTTDGKLHSTVRDVILRMTDAGLSAQDIVDRLHHPQVAAAETVDYVRRTYMRGHSYVET